jgi:hypothetical protein
MGEVYRDKERGNVGVWRARLGDRAEPREMTNHTTRWEITMEVQTSLLIGEFHTLANGTT